MGDLTLRLRSGRFNLRVGAVILHEGRLLAMQDENAPYFYLPGGRVRLHETAEDALLRELREELGVELAVGEPVTEVTYRYPDVTVHLTLLSAAITAGEPRKLEHADIRWMTPAEAKDYPFCPADRIFLERLEAHW